MSSRTLVVDLLTKRVPTHLISGLLVCQAHRYMPTLSCVRAIERGTGASLFRGVADVLPPPGGGLQGDRSIDRGLHPTPLSRIKQGAPATVPLVALSLFTRLMVRRCWCGWYIDRLHQGLHGLP